MARKFPKIIGIAGTNGAGKDLLSALLARLLSYLVVSLSDTLRARLKTLGIDIAERDKLRELSAKWETEQGEGALVKMTLRDHLDGKKGVKGLIIVSVRRPSEARAIQARGGTVMWLTADSKLRYARTQTRTQDRYNEKSYDEFVRQEQIEMFPEPGNTTAPNMDGVRRIANVHLNNNFRWKWLFVVYALAKLLYAFVLKPNK